MRALAILSLLLSLPLAACAGGGASTVAAPSFDCAKAANSVETLVCEDPQLSRLDSELAANYALAEGDRDSIPAGQSLRAAQQRWVAGRDRCGAEPDPQACLVRSYAQRIQELRMGSGVARSADDGITHGPFAVHCQGVENPLVATFINAEPNLVFLSGSNGSQVLLQAMSASGARYADASETTVFWNKGNDALYQSPGAADTNCTLEPI